MMCDIEKIEILMYDVRMQLVNVFRWAFRRGFREVGAIQGSVFFRSQVWRFPVADGCGALQLFSFLSWLVSTCLTVAAYLSTLCC